MHSMIRRLFLLGLAGLNLAAQAPGSARIAAVEHGLLPAVVIKGEPAGHYDNRDRMSCYGAPGVSVAVINGYKIEWAKGYGYRDKERRLPVDTDTLFEAGSISKPVAATGALWLVDQHKLDLDEDVNRKLRSWKVPENEFTSTEKVTLRRLLSHSAGLTVHGFPGYEAGAPVPGKYHTYPEMAAAGLRTTASDLARFGIEIMNSFRGRSNRVLSEPMTRQMLTRQSGDSGLGLAIGGTAEAPLFSHGGVDEGFEALLFCVRDKGQGAVAMTNARGGTALANEIVHGIAAAYGWPGYHPRERSAIRLSRESLRRFLGRYTFDGRTIAFAPESETRFFALAPAVPDIAFERGPDGGVTGIRLGGPLVRKVE
jgi:CubicO group peptidase (beta-lactamase class C family)